MRCLPRSTSFNVSPRKPSRSVSSGITSSGGMLPRLTDAPNSLTNHACAAFVGASKTMFAGPTTFAISLISSVRMPPDESKMPAVPPSRASVITFQAPASSSSCSHCVHSSAEYSTLESFDPTSESTVKSRAKSAISSSLRSRGMSIVPSEISTCVSPSSVSHCLYSSRLPQRIHDLEERPADHHGLVAQHLELALEIVRDVRGAPAELDDRDVIAGDLEHVLPRARAEALVDHVRQADVLAETEIKGGHRAPPASPWRASARRGRASCRARRCRPSAGRSP